ncbi:MAG: penicillin acylase family protein [Blastocatellia bacterium]|nr:penicillin acylase family protein [Blastocatellia bacterium]
MRPVLTFALVLLTVSSMLSWHPVSPAAAKAAPNGIVQTPQLPGLQAPVRVVRDTEGIPHIFAKNDHDAFLAQGYIHASDRFFQMDTLRRQASGRLAELVGQSGLGSDTELRRLGLRRAAEESLNAYPADIRALLQAYADGVNACLKDPTFILPPEYDALELSKTGIPAWTPLDSLTISKAIAFNLSFDSIRDLFLSTALAAYQQAGRNGNFDGTKLFFEDVFRSAPFDPTVSIPNFGGTGAIDPDSRTAQIEAAETAARKLTEVIRPETLEMARDYLRKIQNDQYLREFFDHTAGDTGSNWWIISGARTVSGAPILANDPHLSLSTPSVWYEAHLIVENDPARGPMNVNGVTFAGVPGVVLGTNERICWGATVNPLDVTDLYQEEVVLDKSTQRPKSTTFSGKKENVTVIPQTFQVNQLSDGQKDNLMTVPVADDAAFTYIVPRRNNGPLISVTPTSKKKALGISIQYSGFRATRELEAFLGFNRAKSVEDFRKALQFFDFGSQNFSYADVDGNIAYFTSSEVPLREDLQTLGRVDGTPPYLLRDGTGKFKNEWLALKTRQEGQSLNYEILPFAEMPQVVNPAAGFIANANQDPIGTTIDNNALNQVRKGGGVYYLNVGYADGNRMGRIVRLIQARLASGGKASIEDIRSWQSNNQMLDAEILTPYLLKAFENAKAPTASPALAALGSDPRLTEAVNRLALWDFSTPTGIERGYDPGDNPDLLAAPSETEIRNSIAATTYTAWRSQMVQNVVDATLIRRGLGLYQPFSAQAVAALRNLLDTFPTMQGKGASGVNFFEITGVTNAETARDIMILSSLRDALNQLAGDSFGVAFAKSTAQNDYRWGRLHRITFGHILGSPLSVPPAGKFSSVEPGLPGLSRSGGYETVDAATHNARVTSPASCTFSSGPSRRFTGEMSTQGISAFQILPGGEPGDVRNPLFANQLGRWLTNRYHQMWLTSKQVEDSQATEVMFTP